MYMCVYMCIYICVCVCIHMHVYIYIIKMGYIEYRTDNFGLKKHLPESVEKTYT